MKSDFHEILDTLEEMDTKKVLATIVNVDGSSYKKVGSMMVFEENGNQIGMLSGGCLEEDLQIRSKDFFTESNSMIVTYDLTAEDDLSWGQGVGCNGTIKVLIETVSPLLYIHLKKVKELVSNGYTVIHVKRLTIEGVISDYLFVTDKGDYFGQWKGDVPQIHDLPINEIKSDDKYLYFKQEIHAKPRLFIYGAGADARPLAQLAHQIGYEVIVVDWRPAYCRKEYFPTASKTVVLSPKEFLSSYTFTNSDSIVLMTHHFQKDLELLDFLLNRQMKYLGILGSKDRAKRLLEGKKVPEWVRSPVGLSIGAEGADEIAVSVVAELIQNKVKGCVSVV